MHWSKTYYYKYIHNKLQQDWNYSQTENKLQQIYPTIPPQSTLRPSFQQREHILYNWLRIGHTRLNSLLLIIHILQNALIAVNYFLLNVLTEFISYNQTRQQCYVHTNLNDIFSHSPTKNILNFIKNVNLHDKF